MPAGMFCPRIAGAGGSCCPWRVASADTGTKILSRARIHETSIRVDFARCHFYPAPAAVASASHSAPEPSGVAIRPVRRPCPVRLRRPIPEPSHRVRPVPASLPSHRVAPSKASGFGGGADATSQGPRTQLRR
jgi:hypothetical protein